MTEIHVIQLLSGALTAIVAALITYISVAKKRVTEEEVNQRLEAVRLEFLREIENLKAQCTAHRTNCGNMVTQRDDSMERIATEQFATLRDMINGQQEQLNRIFQRLQEIGSEVSELKGKYNGQRSSGENR